MIGLTRLHLYKAGRFWLLDVPNNEAEAVRLRRAREGWLCTYKETV